MDGDLTRSPGVLVVAVTLICAASAAGQTNDPIDEELRQLIAAYELTGDPSDGRELPAIDDSLPQLGKLLFFSKALSGDLDVACARCQSASARGTNAEE